MTEQKLFILLKNIYHKVWDHFHYFTGKYGGAANSIFNSKYVVHKEISRIFENGSNYDH